MEGFSLMNIQMLPGHAQQSILRCFSLISLLFIPWASFGQSTGDLDPALIENSGSMAPVIVDGEVLFQVKGVSSYPAALRAETIRKRLEKIASNYAISPESVQIVHSEIKDQILAGDELILNIYDADAEAEEISRGVFAEVAAGKIKEIIKQYRSERRPEIIKANAIKAVVAFALMIVLMYVLFWSLRRLYNAFNRRIKKRIDTLENVSFKLIQSQNLIKGLHVVYTTIRFLLLFVILLVFIDYILSLFPWTKGAAKYLLDIILNPLKAMAFGFVDYLPSLIFLAIIFIITRYVLRLIRLFFAGIGNGAIEINNFDTDWAMPTYRIVRLVIIAFALVLAFPYIPGSETSAFKGVSVFLGVLFSLGSSSFIANMIAGYSMTYRRAFKIGDRIEINEMSGYVEEQSLMVTRLRSFKNEEIVIPNSIMLNSSLINYSAKIKDKGLILHTTVGIGYETPWRQVDAMLKLAADRTSGLLKDPPPYVLKRALGDFAITYEINAYCDDATKVLYNYNELHQHILDIFNENNVQIMTPAYEGDPETPKVVPKDQWNTPLASEK